MYAMCLTLLTLSSEVVSNGYPSKCSVLSTRVSECQNIGKGGLDQYGADALVDTFVSRSEKVWDWKG